LSLGSCTAVFSEFFVPTTVTGEGKLTLSSRVDGKLTYLSLSKIADVFNTYFLFTENTE
jgi:hypothetical protein